MKRALVLIVLVLATWPARAQQPPPPEDRAAEAARLRRYLSKEEPTDGSFVTLPFMAITRLSWHHSA
jgi:hypothetical protein